MEERRSGYRGKWLKWALIYLVAGAIVYFIVYLVFLNHGGGGYVMVPTVGRSDPADPSPPTPSFDRRLSV